MSKRTKSLLIKYGCSIGACLVIAALYVVNANIQYLELKDQLRTLADAFFLPGFLCLASGLLLWLSQEGAFNGIGYVLSYALHAIMPGPLNKRESYKEYLERQKEKDKGGFGFLVITGIVIILISTVFTVLFHMN